MNCTAAKVHEIWRAWQQLGIAGFIGGRYTGRPGSTATTRAEVGTNVPASNRVPGGWTLMYYLNTSDHAWLNADNYGHVMLFGGDKGAYNGQFTTEPVLFVQEAYELDKKIDDGLPRTGTVRPWNNYWLPSSSPGPTAGAGTSYCISGSDRYEIHDDKSTYVCSMIFIPGF